MKKDKLLNIFILFLVLTGLSGIAYPLLITGFAKIFFPEKSAGHILFQDEKAIGSKLIGQNFTQLKYFWGRPSLANYDPLNSSSSNKGWISKDLKDSVEKNRKKFSEANGIKESEVPDEMVYHSASGLDPHISPASAFLQINRVAKARNFNEFQEQALINLVKQSVEPPIFGFIGEARVNVLLLNINLDQIH